MMTGHKTQWGLLQRAVEGNRPPQAMIFSGSDLAGQKELALRFFKLMNKGKNLERDLIIISPNDREIQIGQIRDLSNALSFRPQFADFKAVIIEKADALNHLAQNCFLKTLEEPQGRTFFILITAFPEILLPTVRSRCCMLKFFPTQQQEYKQNDEVAALLKNDLAYKFNFAKSFFDKEITLQETEMLLEDFMKYLRSILLAKLGIGEPGPSFYNLDSYSAEQLKQALALTCDLKFLFKSTNINQRLGFENLMLNL